ncbi:MAG: hypothetical protein OSA98_02560 [Rubripirellula sp.]|nr:hypothetical protein [Rubripirellula sp.]
MFSIGGFVPELKHWKINQFQGAKEKKAVTSEGPEGNAALEWILKVQQSNHRNFPSNPEIKKNCKATGCRL